MARQFRESLVRRDSRGRFAHKGRTGTYAVRGAKTSSDGRAKKKKLSRGGGYTTTKYESALVRRGVGENIRKERGIPFGSKSLVGTARGRSARFKALGLGPGMRRRGQTVRKITRERVKTRETPRLVPMGALARSGYGTGRRRSVIMVSKTPTARVKRSRAIPRRRLR